jgi:signal transduction histidine kinase
VRPALAAKFERFLALRTRNGGWEGAERVCREALAIACEVTGSRIGALYFINGSMGWVTATFGAAERRMMPVEADMIQQGAPSLRAVISRGESVVDLGDPWPFPGLEQIGVAPEITMAFPLACCGDPAGALVLGRQDRASVPEDTVFMVEMLAWQVAAYLNQAELVEKLRHQAGSLEATVAERSRQLDEALQERERMHDATKSQVERLKQFTEVAMRINGSGELEQLLDAIAELASRFLRAEMSCIALANPDGIFRLMPDFGHHGLSTRLVETFQTVPGKGLHAIAISTGAPVGVRDAASDDRIVNRQAMEEGWRAIIVAPLLVGDRAIGVLIAGDKSVHDWSEDAVEVMRFLASQGASAIDRARRLEDLQALDRLKDEILGIASHELRTPLTAIKGFAAILASGGEMPIDHVQKYANIIDIEADRMIRLVNDMLNVSRIESGRIELELHPVVVFEMVERAIFASWGAQDGGRISVDVAEDLEVHADSDKLVRILANLLENARKYSESGARVTVCAKAQADNVEIRVWNEGEPFGPGEIDQLFRKFSRLGRHRASGTRGAGLGLYIARQLITAMGGDLWVESSEGGPTFVFSLPAAG